MEKSQLVKQLDSFVNPQFSLRVKCQSERLSKVWTKFLFEIDVKLFWNLLAFYSIGQSCWFVKGQYSDTHSCLKIVKFSLKSMQKGSSLLDVSIVPFCTNAYVRLMLASEMRAAFSVKACCLLKRTQIWVSFCYHELLGYNSCPINSWF